jgi:hypothetical protein
MPQGQAVSIIIAKLFYCIEPDVLILGPTLLCLYFISSRAVRQHWGTLVRSGVVKRDYREISINNVITLGTRIRIVILRVSILAEFAM